MQVSEELRKFWEKNQEHGDVTELARSIGVDHSVISRILTGVSQRAPSQTVIKINRFYKKREVVVKKAQSVFED
jgi:hypothetical protein